ncbi:MAG: hypothetical protein J6X85_07460 [Ruminococcus sp.]|nr:hypothetical protein [Ruminococcus sp.]
MPVKAVNIGEYGYMPFSFDCAMAAYDVSVNRRYIVSKKQAHLGEPV